MNLPIPQPRPSFGMRDARIGNDERDATVDALTAHYSAGRITHEELEERSALALAARTHGELAPLLADLPAVPHRTSGPGLGWVIVGWLVAGLSAVTTLIVGLIALIAVAVGGSWSSLLAPLLPLLIAVASAWFAIEVQKRRKR